VKELPRRRREGSCLGAWTKCVSSAGAARGGKEVQASGGVVEVDKADAHAPRFSGLAHATRAGLSIAGAGTTGA